MREKGPASRPRSHSRRRQMGTSPKQITDISGLTHGVGWCAPQQGACKLTLNVKDGIIEEALDRDDRLLGHDAFRRHGGGDPDRQDAFWRRSTPTSCATPSTPPCASCSCRSSMARTQTAFSEDGLPVGAGLGRPRQGPALAGRYHVRHQRQGRPLSGNGRRLLPRNGSRRGRPGHRL